MPRWIVVAGEIVVGVLMAWFQSLTWYSLMRTPRFWINVLFPVLTLFGIVSGGFMSLSCLAALNIALLIGNVQHVRETITKLSAKDTPANELEALVKQALQ